MRRQILCFILVAAFLAPTTAMFAAKGCECGEHATGITTYTVGDLQGCCTGVASEYGMSILYRPGEGGTWEVESTTIITGAQAQADCCPQN